MVKIFIGNLSQDTTSDELRSQFGKISECTILKNSGVVYLDNQAEAEEAIRNLHQMDHSLFSFDCFWLVAGGMMLLDWPELVGSESQEDGVTLVPMCQLGDVLGEELYMRTGISDDKQI